MAELADALDLGSSALWRESSSLSGRTFSRGRRGCSDAPEKSLGNVQVACRLPRLSRLTGEWAYHFLRILTAKPYWFTHVADLQI